jgi:hypothetical protein
MSERGGGGGVRTLGPGFPQRAPTANAACGRGALEIGEGGDQSLTDGPTWPRGGCCDSGLGWVGGSSPLRNKDFYFSQMDF